MVNVKTKGLLDGQFTKLFKDLYIKTSVKPLVSELPYPTELSPYLDVLYGAFNSEYKLTQNKFSIKSKYDIKEDDTRVLCAFSGGKDSLANVLLLREYGYEPIIFFVKGVNRSYPYEYQTSIELANKLGIELITYNLSVTGKCDYVENPTKNQFILSLMVDYGLLRGIGNYSFGAFTEDRIEIMSADYMLSDSYEMFESVEKFYQAFIPNFNIVNMLENEPESYYRICNYDKSLLDYTYSCMTPLRYKQNLVRNAEKKYGITLLPNRCPSCHKCSIEAITLNKMGVTNYPAEFIKHCEANLERLGKRHNESIKNVEKADAMDWVDMKYINKYIKEHKNKGVRKGGKRR